MSFQKLLFITLLFLCSATICLSQTKTIAAEVKSSAAYAEIILRQTEVESDLEELLVSYTEEFPKVKELRYELKLLQTDFNKIAKMKPNEAGKLTQALGKLLVRKAQVATDYWFLKERYNEEHPDVKKAKRKLQIFENAVKKIMD